MFVILKYSILKVVHVVEALAGGIHTYFKDLSFFFGDNEINGNIKTTIIYSGNRKEINSERIKKEFSTGVSLIELNMVRSFSPFQDLKSLLGLIKELKKINPDVIHLHSSKAGVLGRIACFTLLKKTKLFYTPHGYSFLRTDISDFTQKSYRLIESGFQKIFGGKTIACGDTEYEIAQKIGESYLVRNGIDIRRVNGKITKNSNTVLTIGIVGRITSARNPGLFNQIALRFPYFNFVWIGDGELKSEITAPNIRITGWFLEREDALNELNKIDIYIQTSLWEGLPIAVLEAMVMQKPVLATNIIGNKDVVVHCETGFLFDDICDLENYLEILQDKTTRDSFGKKGLERCSKLFDNNENFKELISLYQR
jgi:glycosyltransferase involved in cell wall biosynthesis